MSGLMINLVSSDDDGKPTKIIVSSNDDKSIPHKSLGNDKHQKFLHKRQFLERRGLLKDKQNKHKNKVRPWSGPSKEGPSHQGQPPWQNGALRPPPPSATKKPNPFHTHRLGSATSSDSQPSASTNSPASLTVSVMNTGNPEQSQKTVKFNSTKATASSPRNTFHTQRSGSATSSDSQPSASTNSPASLTVSVANTGNPEQSQKAVKFNSTKATASYPRGSGPIGNPAKYLAIDCEMVGTGPKGRVSQLARCSIVSYEGDVMYDKFIKPPVPVTDLRTRWSGIRWRDLAKATPYTDARKEILRLITGKVVIGHAIHNDFKALSYFHPAALTRDTSRIPLLNQKAGFADKECASLKRLTKAIFNRDIQVGKMGHSSVEDAKATMELYKVVEVEWERKLTSGS